MKKNIRPLLMIAVVVLTPVFIAGVLHLIGYQPSVKLGGRLYQPPRMMTPEVRLLDRQNAPWDMLAAKKWTLLHAIPSHCAEDCLQEVSLMRSMHFRLHRLAHRVQYVGWLDAPLSERSMRRLAEIDFIRWVTASEPQVVYDWLSDRHLANNSVWLIDPRGRAVIAYSSPLPAKQMLSDIKTLLKTGL